AVQRARLFELDALSRTRIAASFGRGPWAAGLGYESFGPAELRRTRAVLGLSWRSFGIAWSERRGASDEGRGGSLDLAARARFAQAFEVQASARGVLAGGDPRVAADPD